MLYTNITAKVSWPYCQTLHMYYYCNVHNYYTDGHYSASFDTISKGIQYFDADTSNSADASDATYTSVSDNTKLL